MSEPRGVTIHDPATDELVHDTTWELADGRVLRLRLARGRIVEGGPEDRGAWIDVLRAAGEPEPLV